MSFCSSVTFHGLKAHCWGDTLSKWWNSTVWHSVTYEDDTVSLASVLLISYTVQIMQLIRVSLNEPWTFHSPGYYLSLVLRSSFWFLLICNYSRWFDVLTQMPQYFWLYVKIMKLGMFLEYPWNQSVMLRNLQQWMFLPNPVYPLAAYKLVCKYTCFWREFSCSLKSLTCITPNKNDQHHEHFGGTASS